MKQKEFLTVMAVLDEETQRKMTELQQKIISSGLKGTQTMGIPFHLSLGSFPTDREKELTERIIRIAPAVRKFSVLLKQWNTFGFRVLFAEPEITDELVALHALFDGNYADGFPWQPHCTLFCGEESEVRQALSLVEDAAFPIHTEITAIEMGKFFPPRFICRENLI